MTIIAGIDEAGYGPTLGPLVVSRAVFRASAPRPGLWNYSSLPADGDQIINDSKQLYHGAKNLKALEQPVLAALCHLTADLPDSFNRALQAMCRDGILARAEKYPWYRGKDFPLPLNAAPADVRDLARRLSGFFPSGTQLLAVASLPVFSGEFNVGLDKFGNKATALFDVVAEHLQTLTGQYPEEDLVILTDKQGGRDHYHALLAGLWLGETRILREGREASEYEILTPRRRITVGFYKGGDALFYPVGLASMASKYLRELCMNAFNVFWKSHLPELAPTAGYPEDAIRFLSETAEVRRRLNIPDQVLIRKK